MVPSAIAPHHGAALALRQGNARPANSRRSCPLAAARKEGAPKQKQPEWPTTDSSNAVGLGTQPADGLSDSGLSSNSSRCSGSVEGSTGSTGSNGLGIGKPQRRGSSKPHRDGQERSRGRPGTGSMPPPAQPPGTIDLWRSVMLGPAPWRPPTSFEIDLTHSEQLCSAGEAEAVVRKLEQCQLPLPSKEHCLAGVQHHVQSLLRLDMMDQDMRARAARSVGVHWNWVQADERWAIVVAYMALAQVELPRLAQASQATGLTLAQQDAILRELTKHELSVANIFVFTSTRSAVRRGVEERSLYSVVGPWLEASCQALVSLPQADVAMRKHIASCTTLYARYLIAAASIAASVEEAPLTAASAAAFLPKAVPIRQRLENSIYIRGGPMTDLGRTVLTREVARTCLVPLLSFAECQRWLLQHDPRNAAMRSMTELQDFCLRLLVHVEQRSVHRASAPLKNSGWEMVLAYRVIAALQDLQSSGQPDMEQPASAIQRLLKLLRDVVRKRSLLPNAARAVENFRAMATLPLRSQTEWQEQAAALLRGAAEALEAGNTDTAEAIVLQHCLRMLQEPVLVSLDIRAPSWEALGGTRLVQGAVRAGASDLLLLLRRLRSDGLFADAVGLEDLMQCHLMAGQAQSAVELIEEEMVESPLTPAQACMPELWELLGNACALVAARSEDASLLPRLLAAVQAVSAYSSQPPAGLSGLSLVSRRAVQVLTSCQQDSGKLAASLLTLLRQLAASGFPLHALMPAWQATLAAGQAETALQHLSELEADSLSGDGSQAGSKEREEAAELALRATGLAGMLLQSPLGDAHRLAHALSVLDDPGPATCLLCRLLLIRSDCAAAAWTVLQAGTSLSAACQAEPDTVLRVVTQLHKQRSFAEVVAVHARLQFCGPDAQAINTEVQQLAALAHASSGAAAQAVELASPLGYEALSGVAQALLELGTPLEPRVAALLLDACLQSDHIKSTAELCRQLTAADVAAPGGTSPSVVAAIVQAHLQQAMHPEFSPAQQRASLGEALAALEAHQSALLAGSGARLAQAVSYAAVQLLRSETAQLNGAAVLQCYQTAAAGEMGAAGGEAAGAASQPMYASLLPPVRLALWGAALLAACSRATGSKGDPSAGGAEQLPTLVEAVGAHGGSGQLLLFLRLLPLQAGAAPDSAAWDALLRCAHHDEVLVSNSSSDDAANTCLSVAAHQMDWVCHQLRASDPLWMAQLSTPAMLAVLQVGSGLQDTGLMLGAFEGLQDRKDISKDDASVLNACYSHLLAATFFPRPPPAQTAAGKKKAALAAGIESEQEAQERQTSEAANAELREAEQIQCVALCTRLVDGWKRQMSQVNAIPTPSTAAAYEATAATRMLGQLQYGAGWKDLTGTAGQWGRPPSVHTVLIVLRGLGRLVQERRQEPLQLAVLLDISRQAVADLAGDGTKPGLRNVAAVGIGSSAAAAASSTSFSAASPASDSAASSGSSSASSSSNSAARSAASLSRVQSSSAASSAATLAAAAWPALDCTLAEASLELLVTCHDVAASASDQREQQASVSGKGLLMEGAQAVMVCLCSQKQRLTAPICEAIVEAFEADPELAAWAEAVFMATPLARVEQLGCGGEVRPLPVLCWRNPRRQQQATDCAGDEWATDSCLDEQAPPVERTLSAEEAAAEQMRAQRMAELSSINNFEDLRQHLLRHGWTERSKNHRVFSMVEVGLPGFPRQTYTQGKTSSDCRAIFKAKCQLRRIYRKLGMAHKLHRQGAADSGADERPSTLAA